MKYDKNKFTNSSISQIDARDELYSIWENYDAPKDEKERSLSLFLRGSQLARILAVEELYKRIIDIPGSICDFGTWRGSTAVLCENLRAIYEPLNFQRHIYAFDTFEGYKGFKAYESSNKNITNGTYKVEDDYDVFLSHLLEVHEKNNAMGHINGKHFVIKGDISNTFPNLLKENQGLFISLAFFDLNSYEPTFVTLENLLKRLVNGGVIAFWQFSRLEIQAEARAFFDLLHNDINYSIYRCKTYPSLVYIRKEK